MFLIAPCNIESVCSNPHLLQSTQITDTYSDPTPPSATWLEFLRATPISNRYQQWNYKLNHPGHSTWYLPSHTYNTYAWLVPDLYHLHPRLPPPGVLPVLQVKEYMIGVRKEKPLIMKCITPVAVVDIPNPANLRMATRRFLQVTIPPCISHSSNVRRALYAALFTLLLIKYSAPGVQLFLSAAMFCFFSHAGKQTFSWLFPLDWPGWLLCWFVYISLITPLPKLSGPPFTIIYVLLSCFKERTMH